MKQKLLNNFRLRATLLVAMLCVAFTGVRATDVTYKLTIDANDFNTTSYAANNNEKTSNAVCVTDNTKTFEVKWTSNQVMKNGSNVQWQKSKGCIYNSTNLGTITGVTVTSSAGSFTTYYGDEEQPSSSTTVGGGFFQIKVGGATGTASKIEVTFTVSEGGDTNLEESDLALTGAPVALVFDLYNNASAQVINYTTSSTGAVTVASSEYINAEVSNGTITVTPLKKTSDAVVITVNQAADDNYKAGSTTFTINITDSTPKTGAWVLTSLADLGQGDVFVIVGNNGSNYAMSNDNGTSSAPTAVEVTIENDEITSDVDDNIKWNIGGNATDGYTFYPNGDSEIWLYCTSANNGVRVGTNDNKIFVIDSNYLKHSATSRYVGVYNSSDWRCYTNTTGNIANQTFAFYKYVDNTTPKVLSSITLSGEYPTSFHVGDAFSHEGMAVTATYDNASTKDVTASATFSGYDMAAVGNQTVTVSYTENEVTKTAEYSITVNAPATLTSITLSGTYPTEFEQGDAFSSEGIVVTANFDDNTTSDVTASATFSGYVMSVIGEQTVTVTYEDKSTTYTINVAEKKGVENNPYTVAEARAAIDAGTGVTGVYATGVISQVDSYNSNYNSITYWISEDGTTTSDQLEIYSGKGLNNTNFTSVNDVVVGATVVVYGTLKKYGDVYEFDKNNYLTSYSAPAVAVEAPTFSPIAGTYADAQNVTISCETADATIYYTTDGTEPTNQSTEYTSAIAVNADMTIKAIAYDVTGANSTVATATYHICSAVNPYTVTQALAFSEYPANGVYVSGIVSTAPTQSPTNNGQLTYYISVNGETTNQLQVYKGLGLNEAAFTAQDDIQVGDEVTIYGNVKIYNNTKEFDTGNYLVAFNRPNAPKIIVSTTSLTGFTYVTGNGPSATQQITIGGENIPTNLATAVFWDDNSSFEFAFEENGEYESWGEWGLQPNLDVILYVRLKAGLPVGDYTNDITISVEGAETVTVNLTGSVTTAPEAPNVTWNLATASYDEVTNENIVTWSSSYATMTNSSESGGTKASNYLGGDANNRTSSRFYSGNTLTITPASGFEITSIVFEATSESYASALAGSEWTNASASASKTTVTVTPTDGATAVSAAIGGTCGFTSAKVYYQDLLGYPSITLEQYEYNLNIDGGDAVLPVTCTNLADDPKLAVVFVESDGETPATYDWITATINNEGNIAGHIDPNTGDARTAYFKVAGVDANYNAVYSELVTINQDAYTGPSITFEKSSIDLTAGGESDRKMSFEAIGFATAPTFEVVFFEQDGVTAANYGWVTTANIEGGKVNLSVEANDGEARTAYFKVHAIGTEIYSNLVTINQAAPEVPIVPAVAGEGAFVKVTSNDDLTNGTYLIVYEGDETHDAVAFNGGLETLDAIGNTIKVNIVNGKIESSVATVAATFDIRPSSSTIFSKSGKYIGNTSNSNALTASEEELTNTTSIDESYNATITSSGGAYLRYNSASNQLRFRYYKSSSYTNQQPIALYKYVAAETPFATAKLNAEGYATFSSVAKIDLHVEKDFSAWQITSINGTTITFEEVTSVAPASTGLLLKGTADNVAVLTVTDADETTLLDNKLIGITTPTQVETGIYYGLKGNEFVPVNAGTVPAGKALLPAPDPTSGVKAYTFIFNDADGIQTIETVSAEKAQAIFNLAGQRLPKAQKGINIINGKKVLVK